MSSREIAQLTGKRHDNVMADIRRILDEVGISAPKFSGVYKNQQGRDTPCFNLPRRECDLVISGYSLSEAEIDQGKFSQVYNAGLGEGQFSRSYKSSQNKKVLGYSRNGSARITHVPDEWRGGDIRCHPSGSKKWPC
ncbi:Rha family transcriptional regulator [Methylomonas koyamae]|uniref:Rha family transcriptional regulator n=1 Tax=Methylomonas koyamae TaxID=702114 RepID=UPI0018D2E8DE|nr:Rha family transcriptional regulator [Methylomonas koyamae]